MTKSIVTSIRPTTLSKEFAALEGKIRVGMKSWETVGACLSEINENSFHHERGFKTFEAYVETIFDMTRDYAYKIMRANEIVTLLKNAGFKPAQMPINESQVRPLTTISGNDDLICKIWDRVVASDKKTTAKLVKEIADELQGKGTGKADKADKPDAKEKKDSEESPCDLPDTSDADEIARLTHELAAARQRAAIAEAKLHAYESGEPRKLTKLQREIISEGFKALAKNADSALKTNLAAAKKALLN